MTKPWKLFLEETELADSFCLPSSMLYQDEINCTKKRLGMIVMWIDNGQGQNTKMQFCTILNENIEIMQ